MLTIPIALFGDYWINAQEVEDNIRGMDITQTVHLDFQAEGVSATASGIVQRLLSICKDTGRSVDTIAFINNPNWVEQTCFTNAGAHRKFPSHFLRGALLRSYWRDPPTEDADAVLFGLFIGRRTVARDMILKDCLTMPERFLYSVMANLSGIQAHDNEEIHEWMPADQIQDWKHWRSNLRLISLDGKSTRDQYNSHPGSTNISILDFYHRFRVEVVLETYTRGETFFPTEKTARPLMAKKPILVYGPKNFLARLRDFYGYRTWGDHWDETYDQLEGAARWQAMWQSMQDISCNVLEDAQDIVLHNRKISEKMKEWKP